MRCWDERVKAFAVSSVLDHCFSTTVLPGLASFYFQLLHSDQANAADERGELTVAAF